jgi:hypothetical protein
MANDRDGRQRVQLPWSSDGHHADEVRRRRDPELMRVIREAEGKGIFGSAGMSGLPAWQVVNATHNPYWNIGLGGGFMWVGAFVFDKLAENLWAALLVGGFFIVGGVWVACVQIGRVPGWHRARRAAKQYLARRGGGTLPPEVRVLT